MKNPFSQVPGAVHATLFPPGSRPTLAATRRRLIVFGGALLLAACQPPPIRPSLAPSPSQHEQQQLQRLIRLIDERLGVAPLVAQSKWNSGAPIDDPARERSILQDVAQRAALAGLEPGLAAAFFQAQFDAGKLLQRRLHAQWRAQGLAPFADVPDLGRSVRPVLDRLTPQLIATLAALQPLLHRSDAGAQIQTLANAWRSVDDEVRAAALRPLLAPSAQR